MSHFRDDLVLKVVRGGWEVVEDFTYHSEMLNKDITVPEGYFTDLASVPRLVRFIVPVANAKNRRASVVHDYLCTHGIELGIVPDQKTSDKVFREALGADGLGRFKSGALYYPVRFFQSIKSVIRK
jgi:hypothetical protein